MLRTRDGGRTWVGIPAPRAAAPAVIRFADARNGWALTGDLQGRATTRRRLYSTHDGGAHWHRVSWGAGAPSAVAAARGTVYGRRVYVYPDATDDLARRPVLDEGNGAALSTRDLPCRDFAGAELAASGDSALVLVCSQGPAAGLEVKTAYSSADAGEHWTKIGSPPEAGYVGSVAATTDGTYYTGSRSQVCCTSPGTAAGRGQRTTSPER